MIVPCYVCPIRVIKVLLLFILAQIRFLCRVWEAQAVEARVKGAGMNTPLMTAIKYGHQEVALELIDAKWDRNDQVGGDN